ncbi:hypothetical protein FLO80_21600 [Aquicoccus porphyridii]|uniref:Uncharacterized protein n=1 Tax=Aquicoccus porphyridii TaxID=1852029 RepID=A0A5A9YX05_9RHOB|nr:hypothetical protein [Aquicoccus porphyridii]KAA0909431.1 hypothetical protein FLO80_21600 [Aquicoccus porphyridii]RAI51772.1 hypothetical protein DOO74_21475 [Rhodobacteraceae bacterium AsT-22]
MGDIENPWHSRPIDVHRWSDHAEVAALVNRIWDEYLPNDETSGPKPITAFRHQLRVLILPDVDPDDGEIFDASCLLCTHGCFSLLRG